jgi:uncharacterized membrane protein
MNKVAVVVFDDEKQAYEGSRAFQDLHREGSITVYADAVIVKEAGGKAALRRAPDPGPLGTLTGLMMGSLVGMLAGPVGMALGAGAGTMLGVALDLTRAGIGDDFLTEVTEFLLPGKAAVVAEIEEEWQAPLDTRMDALGGRVFRRNRVEVEDAFFEKEIAAYRAELDALEAELSKASAQRKARLEVRLRETRAKLEARQERLKARIHAVKEEGDAKMESLRLQLAAAHEDQKVRLQKRMVEVRADYRERVAKLEQAWELMKSALTP